MSLRVYQIKLELTIDDEVSVVGPAKWDWKKLLDIGPNEDAIVVSCSDAEIIPQCDICGRAQDDSPYIMPKMRAFEADWNPETGNHLTCEQFMNETKAIQKAWKSRNDQNKAM